MLSVHAPTEEKDDLSKDVFYDHFEMFSVTLPKKGLTLLMGDFNAKVGRQQHQITFSFNQKCLIIKISMSDPCF